MHLPITLVTACVAGLILIWLSVRVIGSRVQNDMLIGTGESEELLYKVRTHGNFSEYAPLFLIILGAVEGAGGHTTVLMALSVLFIVARVFHVFGMGTNANLKLRQIGVVGTFLSITVVSLYGLYMGLT